MVTAKYLTEKLIVPMRERLRDEARAEGLAEGRAEGRAEANREWADWYRSKMEADEKGIPFNEPPPSFQSETPVNGREANP